MVGVIITIIIIIIRVCGAMQSIWQWVLLQEYICLFVVMQKQLKTTHLVGKWSPLAEPPSIKKSIVKRGR